MTDELRLLLRIEDSLKAAEAQINLLGTLSAEIAPAESLRLEQVLVGRDPRPAALVPQRQRAARPVGPRVAPSLAAARLALGASGGSVWAALLLDRVSELELELALLQTQDDAEFRRLAVRRYSVPPAAARSASVLAASWLHADAAVEQAEGEPLTDLATALIGLCRQSGVDVPVRSADIKARAAIGADALLVAQGARASGREARRIFLHEVVGHLLPRRHAERWPVPPGRVGSRGADMDEEGRAVVIEHEAGLLDPRRRQQLACRHVLAERARSCLEPVEVGLLAWELARQGVPRAVVAESLIRVLRGGGLAREIIYLPGFARVSAIRTEPDILEQLKRGRFSIEAARTLLARGGESTEPSPRFGAPLEP